MIIKKPNTIDRMETGPLQIGEKDWPGTFIRGDESLYCAFILNNLLKEIENKHLELEHVSATDLFVLEDLANTLASCRVNG